jgi:hypothetical protein
MAAKQRGARKFTLLDLARSDELVTNVFAQLQQHSKLVLCCKVCKNWNFLGKQDVLWRKLCHTLWLDKVYVPRDYRALCDSGQSREAYLMSAGDCKRTDITMDELVDLRSYFRFKRTAGKYWTDKDPFWAGDEPFRISFGRDGSVSGFPWDTLQMKWHFVDQEGYTCQGRGSYMRVAVNGRCVPTYKISRHSNWGFIIQVNWQIIRQDIQMQGSGCP